MEQPEGRIRTDGQRAELEITRNDSGRAWWPKP